MSNSVLHFGPVKKKILLKFVPNFPKRRLLALAGVAQWIERQLANKRVTGWIPSQGMSLGCWPGPL